MWKPFFVWQDKVLKKINPADVVCLSTEKNYTRIFLNNETHCMVRSTLATALKKLPPDMFIKVHRSYAVSVYYIDSVYRDHIEACGNPIPIGRLYYKSLTSKLTIID